MANITIVRKRSFVGCLGPINIHIQGYGTVSIRNGETQVIRVLSTPVTIVVDQPDMIFGLHQYRYEVTANQTVYVKWTYGGIQTSIY